MNSKMKFVRLSVSSSAAVKTIHTHATNFCHFLPLNTLYSIVGFCTLPNVGQIKNLTFLKQDQNKKLIKERIMMSHEVDYDHLILWYKVVIFIFLWIGHFFLLLYHHPSAENVHPYFTIRCTIKYFFTLLLFSSFLYTNK